MTKVESLYNSGNLGGRFKPLASAYPALVEAARRDRPKDGFPSNNNRETQPSRSQTNPKKEKENDPSSSSPCLRHGQGVGTYDTLRLTSLGVNASDIRNIGDWTVGVGTTLESLESGDLPALSKRIFLDHTGREVPKGEHRATLGIDYYPKGARVGGEVVGDLFKVTIPSAPAMMYADPLKPLQVADIDPWLERLQGVVSRYVHCDAATFRVSRLDSSTVYDVQNAAAAYIGLFHAITGAKQRRANKKYYEGETVQFFNNSHAVGFYDKSAKEEHSVLGANWQPINALRYEVQRKNASAVQATFGRPLVASDLGTEEVVRKAIELRCASFGQYFPEETKLAKMYSDDLVYWQLMHEPEEGKEQQKRKRNNINNYAKALVIRHGLKDVDHFDFIMRMQGYSREYIARHNKSLRALQLRFNDADNLYEEVKERITSDLKSVA